MQATHVQKRSLKAWWLAIRPKTLSAGFAPITVGTFLVDRDIFKIDWVIASCAIFCSLSIQIAANLFNDALDFIKGADREDRLGPIRVTQSGLLPANEVLAGGLFALVMALISGIPLILQGGSFISALLIASFVFSYLYTGGPYPLSYLGISEVFVILFYGLFATTAAYYLQTGEMDWKIVITSLEIGFLSCIILAINNLRDIEGDTRSNKKTLAVRFGIDFGRKEIAFLILSPFLINLFWIFTAHPLTFLLPLTALPIALNIVRNIYQHPPGRIYNNFFGEASLLILFYAILLVLGFRLM